MMVSFIDENREEFGVEPICAQLPIAPSGYYNVKSRPPSARSRRDVAMIPLLVALWVANYRVYGAHKRVYGVHKLWKAARRAGHDIGRDQVARLMRTAGRYRGNTPAPCAHHAPRQRCGSPRGPR